LLFAQGTLITSKRASRGRNNPPRSIQFAPYFAPLYFVNPIDAIDGANVERHNESPVGPELPSGTADF
jgi:hypothetical protein